MKAKILKLVMASILLLAASNASSDIHYVDELIFSHFSNTDKVPGDLQLTSVCTNVQGSEEHSAYLISAKSGRVSEARLEKSCGSGGCGTTITISDFGKNIKDMVKFCSDVPVLRK